MVIIDIVDKNIIGHGPSDIFLRHTSSKESLDGHKIDKIEDNIKFVCVSSSFTTLRN